MKKRQHFLWALLMALLLLLTACAPTASKKEDPSVLTEADASAETEAPEAEQENSMDEEQENAPDEEQENSMDEEQENFPDEEQENSPDEELLPEDGTYTTKDEVALYIHQYGHLPNNFISKKDAEKLGWSGGSLEPYAPGMCIGGSRFGNYEGLLPEEEGRVYTECDIDTLGAKKRGAKRIVFSNDGLIYYTDDHYESFTLLYGEDADESGDN